MVDIHTAGMTMILISVFHRSAMNNRRLPSRRSSLSSRQSAAPASPTQTAEHAESVADDVPLLVTPELINELVQNGSVASHFRCLSQPREAIGWGGRRHIELEMELGTGDAC